MPVQLSGLPGIVAAFAADGMDASPAAMRTLARSVPKLRFMLDPSFKGSKI